MTDNDKLIDKTAEIVAAYVSRNDVGLDDLASLITRVRTALAGSSPVRVMSDDDDDDMNIKLDPDLQEKFDKFAARGTIDPLTLRHGIEEQQRERNREKDRIEVDAELVSVSHDYLPSMPGIREPDDPAVPVDESVTHDYIICLEDGHKTKLLKRYIRTKFDMTPEIYRRKWKLPYDYPFTAPEYSERRAQIASDTGLGKNG